MAKRFLFLDIVDPEIVTLISNLRSIAMGVEPKSGVHVTLRGPYNREIPLPTIVRSKRILRAYPVLLDGVGDFRAGDRYVVYLKVKHPGLKQLWWKPDFPIRTFGFNPHITIYEGTNAERAKRVRAFLLQENLKFSTVNFDVTTHASDHVDFLRHHSRVGHHFLELVNRRMVRADILARFERALRPSESIALRHEAALRPVG